MSFKSAQASATLGSSLFDQTLLKNVHLHTSPGRTCIAGAEGKLRSAHLRGCNHCEALELGNDPEKIVSIE